MKSITYKIINKKIKITLFMKKKKNLSKIDLTRQEI